MNRLLMLAALFLLASGASLGQGSPCFGGQATFAGVTYSCDGIDLLSRVSVSQMNAGRGNDVWGWTDPVSGREFALMGLDDGTFFVEVSAPSAPVLLGKLPTASTPSVWRDMKVYGNVMYVVSEAAGHGMQIFNLNRLLPLTPDPNRILEPDAVYTGSGSHTLSRAHNIAINEESGYAYVVGARDLNETRLCAGGLYMLDLNAGLGPEFAGCFSADGYTHDVQCVMYNGPDQQYQGREVCLASNENTVTIVDVTDKAAPVMLSQALYPHTGYTHQGWLTSDQRYFFVNDELDESNYQIQTRSIILDVADLQNPSYIGSYTHQTYSVTHNLFIRDDYVFAANYKTGLRILDARALVAGLSPESVTTAAFFDTYPQRACTTPESSCRGSAGFQGAWSTYPYFESGIVLVSDIDNGLFVVYPTGLQVDTEPEPDPTRARLDAFPNPFDQHLSLDLTVEADQHVRIELYDVLGRRMLVAHDAAVQGGNTETIRVDASALPSGVYVVHATGDHFTLTRRVTRVAY